MKCKRDNQKKYQSTIHILHGRDLHGPKFEHETRPVGTENPTREPDRTGGPNREILFYLWYILRLLFMKLGIP